MNPIKLHHGPNRHKIYFIIALFCTSTQYNTLFFTHAFNNDNSLSSSTSTLTIKNMTKKTANLPSSRSSSSSSSSSSSAEQIVMQMSSGGFFDNFNLFGSGGASNNNNDDGDNDDKKQENANKPRSNKYFDNQQYQGTNVIDENYPGNTLIFRIKGMS